MDMLISFIMMLILQHMPISKHHVVYPKYILFLFINHASRNPEKNKLIELLLGFLHTHRNNFIVTLGEDFF